jgi:hypothetical protein
MPLGSEAAQSQSYIDPPTDYYSVSTIRASTGGLARKQLWPYNILNRSNRLQTRASPAG